MVKKVKVMKTQLQNICLLLPNVRGMAEMWAGGQTSACGLSFDRSYDRIVSI
jgi:hypothetical protein